MDNDTPTKFLLKPTKSTTQVKGKENAEPPGDKAQLPVTKKSSFRQIYIPKNRSPNLPLPDDNDSLVKK